MPSYNRRRQILTGFSAEVQANLHDGVGWRDVSPAPAGGAWAWWTDDLVIGQLASDGWHVHAKHVTGLDSTKIGPPANRVCGGGGVWAVAADGGYGYLDSHGNALPLATVLDVSRDGWILLRADYQAGTGTSIIRPDRPRELVPVPGADAYVSPRIENGTVGPYPHDGGYQVVNLDQYLAVTPFGDSSRGWVLSSDGQDFWPDIFVEGGQAFVCSNRTQGAVPGDVRTYTVDLSLPMVPLPPPSSVTVPEIPSYGRAVWVGPEYASDEILGYAADFPGNCEIVWRDIDYSQRARPELPVFADARFWDHQSGATLAAILLHLSVLDDWQDVIAMGRLVAKAHRVPLWAYLDVPVTYDEMTALPVNGIVVQCYPREGESFSAACVRVAENLSHPKVVGALSAAYTGRDRWDLQLTLDLAAFVADLVRRTPRLQMHAYWPWLSNPGRGHQAEHPEFRTLTARMAAASVGVPVSALLPRPPALYASDALILSMMKESYG